MITVNVNNQNHFFSQPVGLLELLEHLDVENSGIAVAINNQVISKTLWSETVLENGSQVLIIQAAQGG
ncbi:thiamine biosynthesis protein [Galbibacter marinus]|uniref:Thiamine biosynthesis protein n=1 Tax=Galbibacter marinus TaxID=555500 RepID=K2NYS4_9FLAO|nr:sulfur carrier protein ThiS [Galbibacter marinus]EKF53948.1 thiamine biosynthesis protein [Galbibacter marinus]